MQRCKADAHFVLQSTRLYYAIFLYTIEDQFVLLSITLYYRVPDCATQATIYTGSPSAGNQLYKQPKHRQPVMETPLYTSSPRTDKPLYTQPQQRRPFIQVAQTQTTSYTGNPSTNNHIYEQPKHRESVISYSTAQAHATEYKRKITPHSKTRNSHLGPDSA
jgi:hypothetical protein